MDFFENDSQKKGNIILAILAGIFGILIGAIAYTAFSMANRIGIIGSGAGAYLSLLFYNKIRKPNKVNYLIILLFIILNILMIFFMDFIIWIILNSQVLTEYNLTFVDLIKIFPRVIIENGLGFYDFLNIFIVIVISIKMGFEIENEN